ncbi:hypothetical protein LCGC14_2225600, partial [marine sediment metagenome]
GALQRLGRRGEGGHEAVASVLDFCAAVDVEGLADDGVVSAQYLLSLRVAQALGEAGGALHVRKQDGDEPGLRLRG